jgi:quinol-cytochrome oxidoreductase complex cytochrome b subunit
VDKHSDSLLKKLDYPVPKHANTILYMFGGISLTAFLILIVSGIFLSQVYSPTPDGAHPSIVYAVTHVPFADFARSLHFWVANLVVFLLLLHIARVFITGSYKKPRRLTWLTGVALLGITTFYIFIGTVLKMDQEGVEALGHMQESFNIFGIHVGLTNAGVPVITQLYSWHTIILTLLLLGLIAIHMVLIKIRGISAKPSKDAVSAVTAGQGTSSFLMHLRRLSGYGLLFLAIAGILAIIFPAPLGQLGIFDQEVTKPLWMFWPFFGLENIFGLKGLVWGMIGFFAILAAIPFIDRNKFLNWRKRKAVLSLGFVFLVAVIGLGAYSRLNKTEAHLGMADKSSMAEIATADNLDLSHQKLRGEAYYVIPALVGLGAVGAWFAYKKPE